MKDAACLNLTKVSVDFWILMHALKRFVEEEGEGALPVSGVIPDMKSDTESYVLLQRMYVAILLLLFSLLTFFCITVITKRHFKMCPLSPSTWRIF